MNKLYYHLTSFTNFLLIQEQGIKAGEDGYIYVLDTKDWNGYLALNQLFLTDYAVFSINPKGITDELEPDNVAEFSAKHQFRIKQPLIEKRYIKFLNMYRITPPSTPNQP